MGNIAASPSSSVNTNTFTSELSPAVPVITTTTTTTSAPTNVTDIIKPSSESIHGTLSAVPVRHIKSVLVPSITFEKKLLAKTRDDDGDIHLARLLLDHVISGKPIAEKFMVQLGLQLLQCRSNAAAAPFPTTASFDDGYNGLSTPLLLSQPHFVTALHELHCRGSFLSLSLSLSAS